MIRPRLRFTRRGWFRLYRVSRRTILLGPFRSGVAAIFMEGFVDAC